MIRPLIFVWPHALGFWLLYALIVVPEKRLEQRSNKTAEAHRAQDRGSVKILHAAGDSAAFLGLAAAIFVPAATISPGRDFAFVVGLMVLAAGELLRHHCYRMLGPYFSGTVHVVEDQPVVERGAYRWVRHPAYSGGMMLAIGIGLSFTNWVSLGFLTIIPALGYMFRVRAEERALVETLGEPYRAYMARTKRFVPFIF
jgi:protein-S-isoprenylcysteine O-methyltransferase Ste14